jgi:serpin B
MFRFVLFAGALALTPSACVSAQPPAAPAVEWSKDVEAAADGNNKFSLDLYAKLRDQKGNLFVSPYSVHAALGMTASGARGTTRDELLAALHLSKEGDKALAVGDMGRYYTAARKDVKLAVANAIWARKGYNWRPEFRDIQEKRFGSGLNEADFVRQPEAERRRINKWVEDQTNNRIKELLQPPHITPNTTMVLVNAIYFKGNWKTQFDAKKTREGVFHTSDDKRIDVKMMHADMKCGYARFEDVSMVELPYAGGELSMVVLLPRMPDGLPKLEEKLTHENLKKWLADLKDRGSLEITLPKFKMETSFDLVPAIQALGVKAAFGAADFGGMAEGDGAPITAIVHKSFVDVNEAGTEAAAATAVVRADSAFPPPFVANHPFLFLIRDAKKGTILFMGRVEKP